jgi:hypothetical protein
MLSDFIERYNEATIVATQSTYLDLQVAAGVFRLYYVDKVEFRLKKGTHGPLAHYSHHPLLVDYQQPHATVYVTSQASNPDGLWQDIAQAVARASNNWRSANSYLLQWRHGADRWAVAKQNLVDGRGLLVEAAPLAIAEAVVEACTRHGATTSLLAAPEPRLGPVPPFGVLFIGSCYVVARSFQIQSL